MFNSFDPWSGTMAGTEILSLVLAGVLRPNKTSARDHASRVHEETIRRPQTKMKIPKRSCLKRNLAYPIRLAYGDHREIQSVLTQEVTGISGQSVLPQKTTWKSGVVR